MNGAAVSDDHGMTVEEGVALGDDDAEGSERTMFVAVGPAPEVHPATMSRTDQATRARAIAYFRLGVV